MVIAIPLTAVILGVAMISIAVATWDGLVVDDYYKQGKEINRVLIRDRFATENGLSAALTYSNDDGRVTLSVDSEQPVEQVPVITLMFLHPTRGGLDRSVELARGPDGRYHGVMPALVEGDWHIQIGTDKWRLGTRVESGTSGSFAVAFRPLGEN